MKVTILGLILCLAALAQTPDQALAGQASRESIARRVTESFDIRGLPQASLLTSALRLDSDRELRKQRKTAIETYLSSSFSGARFTLNSFGLPHNLFRAQAALSPVSESDPVEIAKDFLRDHRGIFSLTEDEIRNLRLAGKDVTEGVVFLNFNQALDGIDVFRGHVKIVLNRSGQVVQVGVGDVIPGLGLETSPTLSPEDAVRSAFRILRLEPPIELAPQPSIQKDKIFFANPLGDNHTPIRVELSIFPMTASSVRLAYRMFFEVDGASWYEMLVDAHDGHLLYRHNHYCPVNDSRTGGN